MRYPRFASALAAVLACVGAAAAQYPLKIESVKVGFPAGPGAAMRDDDQSAAFVCKANLWAPVYVELKVNGETKRQANLVLETTDPDDLGTAISVPLQNLSDVSRGTTLTAAELPYIPYVRLAGRELTVTVREREPAGANPTAGRLLAEPKRLTYVRARETSTYVVLALGSRLPGFELPAEAKQQNPNEYRPARVEQAVIDNPFLLPDRWYGYDAADLVVLATGAASVQNFLTPLFTDPQHKPRLDALLEWVRRGGRLVVSVGQNAAIVANFPVLQEVLPMQVRKDNPAEQVKDLFMEWAVGGGDKRTKLNTLAAKAGTFPVANFVPHPTRGARQVVPPATTLREDARRAVVQAPYGLGRVTLVGFDLDRSPFVDYEDRPKAWDLILRECGAARAPQSQPRTYSSYTGVSEDELAAEMRQHTDSFASVPVISFGWVAVFIILYTLLIGPVEYYVLKKVFKRLELTWITFPIIVLTVSAIAYFSAYALKGSDMKVNKVDLLDIDPATNRVYGHTWFTVFSPRIDTYRIGVEPGEKWVADNDPTHGGVLVDAVGANSGRKGSFFRRSYHYNLAPPGDPATPQFSEGLIDVPIQVWSTKAFAADWSAALDRQAPLVVSDLNHPPAKPENVVGTFTLNLPFKELQDVYLVYAGKAYKWDAIASGVPVNAYLDDTKVDTDWVRKLTGLSAFSTPGQPYNRSGAVTRVSTGAAPIFALMFHEEEQKAADNAQPRNSTLRRLDQSWRLSSLHRDEVMIVGRAATVRDGNAEEVYADPASASPTTLWLRDLPGGAKKRAEQQGTLQQETFVRVYVPVKPFKK
jgi:hypothetical protein